MSALQFALALDTKVPTPNGWNTIGGLEAGDVVYAPDGTKTEIVATTEVYAGDCYQLTFSNGQIVVADGDHLWYASDFKDRLTQGPNYPGIPRSGQVISTRQMFESQMTTHLRPKPNWAISRTTPVEGDHQELPLDPYLFGLWLGDGSKRDGTIAGTAEDNVRRAFVDRGFICTEYNSSRFHVTGLRPILTKMGVRNNKHITDQYLRSSTDQRLELLRGLMDSNGTVNQKYGSCRFFNTDKGIIDGLVEIAHSLGLNPTYTKQSYKRPKMEPGFGWVVDFTADVRVFNLERKYKLQKLKSTRNVIVRKIEKIESTPVKCITVSHPSHLFLITESWIPTHNCDVPGYSALLLRRTYLDLMSPGAILDRFKGWMSNFPEVHKGEGGRLWTFPSGAKIQFGYAARPDDKYKFQGSEYQLILLDEATQFEPEIYTYLSTRLRRPGINCVICSAALTRYYDKEGIVRFRHSQHAKVCESPLPDPAIIAQYQPAPDGLTIFDVPLRQRSTANPGGLSHTFFKERFIDQSHTKSDGKPYDTVFIPSALKDNPSLDRADYEKRLEGLGMVDRERLLNGDWEIMDSGNLFERGWFEHLEDQPDPSEIKSTVRFWDFAASDGKQSDYTAGALCSVLHDGRWVIRDIKRVRYLPPQVEKLVQKTAAEDGIDVKIMAEQEPGASGKAFISYFKRMVLPGYQFNGVRSTGTKTARAGSLVSQASARNVYLVKGDWNVNFLDEATTFPSSTHDDQIDAASSAFIAQTVMKKPVRLIYGKRS